MQVREKSGSKEQRKQYVIILSEKRAKGGCFVVLPIKLLAKVN